MKYLLTLACMLFVHMPDTHTPQLKQASRLKARRSAQQTVICIDPGHPSEVNDGKTIQNGTSEVHIVWVVALKLKKLLEAKGYRVVMTKSREDQLVLNKERALIANRADAALMIRLHCDTGEGGGFTLYHPDGQGTKDDTVGPSAEVIEASGRAARAIHAGMAPLLRGFLKDNGVLGDSKTYVGARQGALTGSIYSQVPVVTIEMVFLSNESDAEFIKSQEGQEKMARAIANGAARFVKPARSSRQR
ncbi:MAG TPA: N-acetylmuramoyl-L-alanine amidase [Pyrinomonadaceae bacterium]|jgi:N-acetylmuramoyl-L-alanine amidase